ncbi:MAG: c-type cytochrome [Bryobacterales bacterium]|nr:c-type cytochrome [Bryobacterales bacterium]MBV9396481.1 c-type cytochrome [Bryobacterales bacterium]
MKTVAVCLVVFGVLLAIASSTGDARRGRGAFEQTCTGCHALDRAKVGPRLRHIYGQPAGKDSQFGYSDAMKGASVTWDDATLDRWLADTESVIPGNDMAFRLDDASKRADIIAYLKALSGK